MCVVDNNLKLQNHAPEPPGWLDWTSWRTQKLKSTSSIPISSPDLLPPSNSSTHQKIWIDVWQTCGRSGHLQVLSLWTHIIWLQWCGHVKCWDLVKIVNSFSPPTHVSAEVTLNIALFFSPSMISRNARTKYSRLLWKLCKELGFFANTIVSQLIYMCIDWFLIDI